MNKCTLAVHEVKLVVDAREYFCDCSGVADHAARAHYFCQVTPWYLDRSGGSSLVELQKRMQNNRGTAP